jgi:hypothetical protein
MCTAKERLELLEQPYLTDDLIKVFHLKPFVARLKKELQDTKKAADA